jgi:hypothetical protein
MTVSPIPRQWLVAEFPRIRGLQMEKRPSAPEAFLPSKESVRPSIGIMPKSRPHPSHRKVFLAGNFTSRSEKLSSWLSVEDWVNAELLDITGEAVEI